MKRKNPKHWQIISMAIIASALAGCGSSSEDDSGDSAGSMVRCESISGGNSTVEVTRRSCVTCSASSQELAGDGDLDTFATLNGTGSTTGTGIGILATAQEGIVYPAGSEAGVFFNVSTNSAGNRDLGITLKTYLDGSIQEEPSEYRLVGTLGGNPYSFKSFVTSQPFDALEVFLTDAQNSSFDIHELCSDGNP